MEFITDGTGRGYRAKVNARNQIAVISESVSGEGARAVDGMSFIIHARCHLAAANTGGLLHIVNNDPNNYISVTRIYIDPYTLTPGDLICTQKFDCEASGGTDVSSTAVVQQNRSSSNLFDLTVLQSDAAADLIITGGTMYHTFALNSRQSIQRHMNETNIIPATKSISFGWYTESGSNAVDGEIVSISLNLVKRAA